jgi:hypothetical protein
LPIEELSCPGNNRSRAHALLLALVQRADRIGLRRLFLQAARSRLHAPKKWAFRQHVRSEQKAAYLRADLPDC